MGEVNVEIVAKQKGCILCDLAIGILEELEPEFAPGILRWSVVDVGSRSGLARMDELSRCCGNRPAVPSIIINEKIAFDHIPDMEALSLAIHEFLPAKAQQDWIQNCLGKPPVLHDMIWCETNNRHGPVIRSDLKCGPEFHQPATG